MNNNINNEVVKFDILGLDGQGTMGIGKDDPGIPKFTVMEKLINQQIEIIKIARKQPGFTDYDFASLNEALKTLEVLRIKNDVADKLIGGK